VKMLLRVMVTSSTTANEIASRTLWCLLYFINSFMSCLRVSTGLARPDAIEECCYRAV
jgi:hypothetical protein